MPERRIVKLERLIVDGASKDRWFIRAASRSRPWIWFEVSAVPPVNAREAYFEIERAAGGWKVLRQVPDPETARRHVVPDLDLSRPWPRAPRRFGELRDTVRRGHVSLRCPCGDLLVRVDEVCRAFDQWTVDELQRAGFWRCRNGCVCAASVYDTSLGVLARVEFWPSREDGMGWVRC